MRRRCGRAESKSFSQEPTRRAMWASRGSVAAPWPARVERCREASSWRLEEERGLVELEPTTRARECECECVENSPIALRASLDHVRCGIRVTRWGARRVESLAPRRV